MPMSAKTKQRFEQSESPQEQNMKALRHIQQEAPQKSEKWRTGQWVGLLNGEMVAVSFDWKEVIAAVDQVVRDRRQAMLFRVGDNYDKVERML